MQGDPNCALEKWQREGLPIIKVMALEDMSAGTELTVSYNWGPEFQCHCGSKKCRYKREQQERDVGSDSGKGGKKRSGHDEGGAASKKHKPTRLDQCMSCRTTECSFFLVLY